MSLTTTLIERVLDDYAQRPAAAVREHAARALFDFEACAAAGRRALPDGLGDGPAAAAAAADALDREDVHWPSVTHPGPIVWPAVLAAADRADASGADAVRAAAAGYEVTARLAVALGAPHRQYWHSTTTAGTVGAAVGAALALGLDVEGAAVAAGHASCVAGGLSQSLVERSGTRVFYRAHAAATGLAAAYAAQAGLDASRFGLEGEKGLFAALAPGSDPEAALAGRPVFAIEELWLRLHSATGFAHTAIDAAAALGPVDRASVRSIAIEAPAVAVALAGNLAPATREDGWWSIPYAVAVTLLAGDPAALDAPELADVSELLAVTTLAAGPGDLAATVTVELDGAPARSESFATPLGHPGRPLDDGQLLAKWRTLGVGPDEEAADLLALARRFADAPVREYLAGRPSSAVALSATTETAVGR